MNNFAISSGGIGEALKRSASALYSANNTLDESIALITSANEVVQNPETVGQAYKTIALRIRGAKSELEDAGLETDGLIESTSKLREEVLALSGVDIMEADGQTFKSTYDVLDELSKVYDDLSDISQANLLEIFAGKRQSNILAATLSNFDTAREALETSLNSAGSAMKEHEKWQESLEAQLNKLKASWQSLAQTFMKSDFLKVLIDLLTWLVDVLEKVIDNFGLFGTIGLGVIGKGIVATFKYFKGGKEAAKTINDVVSAIDNLTDAVTNGASATSEMGESMANVSSASTEAAESTANLAGATTETAESMSNIASTTTEASESTANLTSSATEAGESVSNLGSAATETAETMANLSSATTEAADATANIASASTEAAEATANLASGGSEIVESVGNVASAATEAAEATVSVGSAAVTAGASATKAAGGFKAFATSSAGIALGVGIAIAAIGLLINVYKNYKEEQAELRRETIETADTFLDSASKFEQSYIKYSGRTGLTTEEEADLASAIDATVDALDDKSSALQNTVNSSGDYIKSLEQIARAELEAAAAASKRKRDAAKNDLEEVSVGWTKADGSEVNVHLDTLTGMSPQETKEIDIAKQIGSKYVKEKKGSTRGAAYTSYSLNLDTDADVNEIIDYYYMLVEYQEALSDANLSDTSAYEGVSKAIDKMSESVKTYIDGVYDAAKAQYQLSNGIPKTTEEYLKMREAILKSDEVKGLSFDTKNMIAGTLDSEYKSVFDLSSNKVQSRKLVGIIEGYGDGSVDGTNEIGTVETFLNMRTAVNNNECTVGEYLSQFDEIDKMTANWSDEEKEVFNTTFGIDTDSVKAQYDDMHKYLTRLTPDEPSSGDYWLGIDAFKADIDTFLQSLTADELQAVVDIRTEIDWENTSAEDIRKQIEERAKLNEAMNFEVDFKIDTTALEALNKILEESASACGLTTESIDGLKSKYGELENYNPSTLFERTANGVKVNRDELVKLEKEYQNLKKSDVQKHLDTLVDEYNDVTDEIDKCTNAHERAELISKRETYKDKIEELAEYQAQLEGVTGAYQKWIDAQSAPEDYEGYESVATGREEIQDEISRGLLSNKGKAFIDLLSGEDLEGASVDKYVNAWKKLDEKVGNTGYSINDFFTVNDDGDITSTGINRFFDGVQKNFKDKIYKLNEDTGEWYYDFSQENLDMIQDEWGMGIDAIELMLEAASAAGYDIDWGGILDNLDLDTSSFETLVSEAEKAQEEFNKLKDVEDVDFNFTATGVEEATTEVEKARDAYLDLITNEDGTINLEAKGADKMRTMLATLLIQKQQLEDSNIVMSVNTSGLDESQQEIGEAINAVIQFREKYKNLEIAISTGQGIDEAKTELSNAMTDLQNLGGEGVDIAAQLIMGEGSNGAALKSAVDESIKAIGQPNIEVGAKLDTTIFGHLNTQLKQNFTPEATVKITGIDDSVVNQYTSTEKTADGKVKWTNDDSLVVEYASTEKTAAGTVKWGNDTVDVRKSFSANGTVKWTSGNKVKVDVISEANGTANANGTTGRAYKQGSWGIKGSGTALVGELGMETLVRGGHFYTIGDRGAEFIKYRQGDIIFNHKQTEELFKNGKVTSDGGRGKMFANGSAFADGSYPSSGKAFAWSALGSDSGSRQLKWLKNAIEKTVEKTVKKAVEKEESKGSKNGSPNISATVTGGASASALNELQEKEKDKPDKDKFEETIDFIEIAIDRIERAIDNLDQKANNVYASWSSRNKALADEISKVEEEIDKQNQAYDRYMQEANSVGLSETWAKRVRNGTIDIYDENDFSEDTAKKIKEYQQWYEKAIACKDAIEKLKETEDSLYAQRVENVSTQYEGILGVIEHEKNILDGYISQSEAQSWLVSGEYYNALASNEKENLGKLKEQREKMLSEMQTAMAAKDENGNPLIAKGSEAWYEMVADIDAVTEAIQESETTLLEYGQTIQQLSWETFDLLQEKISAVTDESDFLIDLLSNDKLYEDNGQLTNEGMATMGLHGVNYNTYMYQADLAAKEAAKLKKELAKDPYDTELESRYREMIALQQEHILAAEGEKEAIRDMVEEGINLELESLQELIDKKNEALESEKDLYEYQKKVKEQTEEIASLEKQMAAYSGDTSEEAQSKIQELKVSLEEAKENLQETEYDKYISDQQQMLDDLYEQYSEVLNTRLDDIDALFADMVQEINDNASVIEEALIGQSNSVGYNLSEAMKTIWNSDDLTGTNGVTGVITTYGKQFTDAQTTTNNSLGVINENLQNMITQLNKLAKTNIKSAAISSAENKDEAKTPKENKPKTDDKKTESAKAIKVGGKINAKGAQIYDYAGDKSGERQLYRNDPIYKVLKTSGNWLQVRWHKLSSGITGWFKKGDVKAYAAGARRITSDDVAWTQEKGQEFVVRPSDGAILTPLAQGDSVLNANASNNIWNMANSPAEFIKDNLNFGAANVPNNSSVQNSITQHLDKVVFNLPNVKNYDELLAQMQKDKSFEKLIMAMTIDRIAGGSSLAKNKSIR